VPATVLVDDAPVTLNGDGSARLASERADENPDDQPDPKRDDREDQMQDVIRPVPLHDRRLVVAPGLDPVALAAAMLSALSRAALVRAPARFRLEA
jgi:hypothetical protein